MFYFENGLNCLKWWHFLHFIPKSLLLFFKVFVHLSNIFTNWILIHIFICKIFSWYRFLKIIKSFRKKLILSFELFWNLFTPSLFEMLLANQVHGINYKKVNKRSKTESETAHLKYLMKKVMNECMNFAISVPESWKHGELLGDTFSIFYLGKIENMAVTKEVHHVEKSVLRPVFKFGPV